MQKKFSKISSPENKKLSNKNNTCKNKIMLKRQIYIQLIYTSYTYIKTKKIFKEKGFIFIKKLRQQKMKKGTSFELY